MDLIKRMREIRSMPYPEGKKRHLRITSTDGIVLTGRLCCVVGALDNEPEIAELDFYRDDNGGLTGILETEIESVELIDD